MLNSKGNKQANRLYAALIFCLSNVVLENILIISREIFHYPHLFSVGAIWMFMVPPLGYLLQKSLLEPTSKFGVIYILKHSLPFLICVAMMIPLYSNNGFIKAEIIENVYFRHKPIQGIYLLFSFLNILQFLFYIILIFKILRVKQKQLLKKQFRYSLSWINYMVVILNALMIIYIIVYTSFILSNKHQHLLIAFFMFLILFSVFYTCFQLIKNPFYFNKHQAVYERSTLKNDIEIMLKKNLGDILKKEKFYLNAKLKLGDLAKALQVNTHQLSQYINQSEGITFTQFINKYRVEHAKDLIAQDTQKDKTILAIALDSGFSNQANFIKVFKSFTGKTPSQFRQTKIDAF